MTRRAFGKPCSLPSDGVITPPAGKPPGPGPSGGHEKHPGLAATRLTFVFQQGVLLNGGTLVDATLIHAAPSTKNRDKTRDPEMHQTKKGNQWYFGMKIHVGADVDSGVVHTVSVTPAHVADVTELPNLLREDDRAVFGDAVYVNDHYTRAARQAGVYWGVALKARPKSRLGSSQKQRNRKHSSIRSRVEHVFRVIKCQFGYTKVRYKGLAKNAAHVFMLVGLANLYLKRRALLA